MDTGRKRKPAHVDEPYLGNVIVANAGDSIYFAAVAELGFKTWVFPLPRHKKNRIHRLKI